MAPEHDLVPVSCDLDRLYRSDGSSELADALPPMEPSSPDIDFVDDLFPAYAYERPAPLTQVCGDEEAARHMRQIESDMARGARRGAASALFRIRDAVLYDNVIHLLRGARRAVVYETARPQDLAHFPLDQAPHPIRDQDSSDGALNLVFTNSASFNYGHWLVEDLPRLKAVRVLRRRFPGRPINLIITTYHEIIDQVRLRSIKLMLEGLRGIRIVTITRDQPLHFDVLHFASPIALHPVLKSPEALAFLAGTLRRRVLLARLRIARDALLATPRRRPLRRRLFVDRAPDYGRRLLNRDDVLALLSGEGFEVVDPLTLPFGQQVAQFADAGVVVGGMGAAMTNTLFSLPGTQVIHLAAEGWNDPFFWDLAAVRGHRYHALYGASDSKERPNHGAFTIDLDALRAALRAATA
ncbi:capsular polysaccharide biosynthesis protein-like protein [Methylobacterium sp. 4-46]|uniref:glycosyltransferase family 61 protein n=1 Tax=unclassified Methylobacterium TaxID=2615210 RepID=UPI000165CB6F|nr:MULTISPECIES: glycosyltransferase family 61 protein [Methylobacterium]ACA20225.1 capsular polysaccharide biosynthesis protein-like protein [Methylobacterium sp. 4-46]WFT79403.1 glycosyltransferase family 61 protein [Methylobacterium nodulans]